MKSRDDLQRKWRELAKVWRDGAARAFEDRHVSKIMCCMEKVDEEYGRFEAEVRKGRR